MSLEKSMVETTYEYYNKTKEIFEDLMFRELRPYGIDRDNFEEYANSERLKMIIHNVGSSYFYLVYLDGDEIFVIEEHGEIIQRDDTYGIQYQVRVVSRKGVRF